MGITIRSTTILILFLILGCNTSKTKEQYLVDYQNFMNEVKNNWKFYSEENWDEKTLEYKNYSESYYKKFKRQLTPSEKVKAYRFDFMFHFYKGDITAGKLLSGEYNQVLKSIFKELWSEINRIGLEIF